MLTLVLRTPPGGHREERLTAARGLKPPLTDNGVADGPLLDSDVWHVEQNEPERCLLQSEVLTQDS